MFQVWISPSQISTGASRGLGWRPSGRSCVRVELVLHSSNQREVVTGWEEIPPLDHCSGSRPRAEGLALPHGATLRWSSVPIGPRAMCAIQEVACRKSAGDSKLEPCRFLPPRHWSGHLVGLSREFRRVGGQWSSFRQDRRPSPPPTHTAPLPPPCAVSFRPSANCQQVAGDCARVFFHRARVPPPPST